MSHVLSAHLRGFDADARNVCAFALRVGATGGSGVGPWVRLIAGVSRDQTMRLWGALSPSAATQEADADRSWKAVAVFRAHQGFVGCVKHIPAGHAALDSLSNGQGAAIFPLGALLTGGNDRTINVWSVPQDAVQLVLGLGGASTSTSSPTSTSTSTSGGGDADMTPAEPLTFLDPVLTLVGHSDGIAGLDVCPDGSVVSCGLEGDKTVRVWRGAECVQVLEGHEHGVWDVCCVAAPGTPAGFVIASASADRTVRLWTASGGPGSPFACTQTLRDHTDCARGLSSLPAIAGFASCANDGQVLLWTAGGDCLGQVPGHDQYVYTLHCVQEPGTGAWLVLTASEDRSARISKLGGTAEDAQSLAHPGTVWGVCGFEMGDSPADYAGACGMGDVVTACADGVVRVFTPEHDLLKAEAEELALYESSLAAQTLSAKGGQVGDIDVDKLPGPEALDEPGAKDGATKLVKIEKPGNNPVVECYSWSSVNSSWTKIGEVVDTANQGAGKALMAGKEYDHVFDVDLGDGGGMRKLGYNNGENPYTVAQQFIDDNELQQDFLTQIAQFIEQNTQAVTIGPSVGSGAAADAQPAPAPVAYQHFPLTAPLLFDAVPNGAALQGKLDEFFPLENMDEAPSPAFKQKTADLLASIARKEVSLADVDHVMALSQYDEARRFPALDMLRLLPTCKFPGEADAGIYSTLVRRLIAGGLQSGRTINRVLALKFVANALNAAPAAGQRDGFRGALSAEEDAVLDAAGDILSLTNTASNKNARIAAASLVLGMCLVVAQDYSSVSEVNDVAARCLSMISDFLVDVNSQHADHDEVLYRLLVAAGSFVYLRPATASFAHDLGLSDALAQLPSKFQPMPPKLAAVRDELARYLQIFKK